MVDLARRAPHNVTDRAGRESSRSDGLTVEPVQTASSPGAAAQAAAPNFDGLLDLPASGVSVRIDFPRWEADLASAAGLQTQQDAGRRFTRAIARVEYQCELLPDPNVT